MPSTRLILRLLGAVSLASLVHGSTAGQAPAPLPSHDFLCQHPPYRAHVVSKSPLVIYLADFLTLEERAHLKDATLHKFSQSAVTDNDGGQQVHRTRTSQSTNIPRDAIVRCIESRALSFQGFDVPRTHLEPLQLVRYGRGEHYHFHKDWFTDPAHATAALGGNRVSSFFAYVAASNGTGGTGDEKIKGGGTNFPLVDAPRDERWCEYVDCDEPWDNGVTFRPVEGNAVYWENMLPGMPGMGDQRTLHAGLPVTRGSKIGMNIWTRQAPLGEDVRGPDM